MATRRDRLVFALAVAVQLVVLYLPRVDTGPVDGPGLDKLVHAAVFAAVAWTGRRAGVPTRWLVGLLVAQAVGSELVQGVLLPDRSGDPLDAAADLAGIAIGLALGGARPGAPRSPRRHDAAASGAPAASRRDRGQVTR